MSTDRLVDREQKLRVIEAQTVTLGTVSKRINTVGHMRANAMVIIKSELSGRIAELLFTEGGAVKKGDLIIRFEDAEYRAAVQIAEGEHENAKSNLERISKLHEQKVESNKKLDEANAQVKIAEGKLLQAKANLEKANLAGSYLNEATFSGANLSEADLSRADLSRADLRGADFRECRVVSTNFTAATLTGACIEDWHINSETNFENVICDYIYYKYDWQTGKYSDRRPHDPNKIFNPGDFQRLIETARETVDLIFSDGIDWETFIKSLHKLQEKFPDSDIAVQGMQKKSDGALVISIEALENIKKSVLESSWWQIYPPLLAEKDSTIRILTDELKSKRQEHTEMLTIIKTMSEKESVQQSNFYGPVGVGNNQGEIQGNAKVAGILNEAEQQNLTEIITEVQAIITPLAQTYPNNPTTQGIKAIEAIEKNPNLKPKLIEAAKKGGLEAFKKSLDNPVGAFIGGAIEGWMGK
jgi:uncharacterized protein YjbI with pentapeptide repeats